MWYEFGDDFVLFVCGAVLAEVVDVEDREAGYFFGRGGFFVGGGDRSEWVRGGEFVEIPRSCA